MFARPGIVVASTGVPVAKALRDAGASTAYWEMNLQNLVGTPGAPADPATMDAVAAAEVQKAQASTACPNPLIALNELLGSDVAGPLPPTAQRYRDAVLALMRALAADGATPFLLVPRRYTVTGTEDWWRQVAQVGWLVPEAYTPATSLWGVGDPFLISRVIRVGFRDWIGRLTALGIPPSRLGLMLGFQSGDAVRRQSGLQPTAAWLAIVKLQSLAGLVVARELGPLDHLVVGVGDVRDARQRGRRQAGRRLHLPVGARPRALRCARARRARLRPRSHGCGRRPRAHRAVPLRRQARSRSPS